MPPPHMRTQENTLWILYQPVSPCSSTTLRVNGSRRRKRCHTSAPKAQRDRERQHADGRRGGGEHAPAPGRQQHQRDHAARTAACRRAARTVCRRASGRRSSIAERHAEQRGGEEAVMAVAEIDEHRRESRARSSQRRSSRCARTPRCRERSRASPRDKARASRPATAAAPADSSSAPARRRAAERTADS